MKMYKEGDELLAGPRGGREGRAAPGLLTLRPTVSQTENNEEESESRIK